MRFLQTFKHIAVIFFTFAIILPQLGYAANQKVDVKPTQTVVPNPYAKNTKTTVSKPINTKIEKPSNYLAKPLPTLNPTRSLQNQTNVNTTSEPAETKEFKVLGLHAWSEAKKNNFRFYPNNTTGQKTGVGEFGSAYVKPPGSKNKPKVKKKGAHMVGGVNMLLYHQKNSRGIDLNSSAKFYLFYGKNLRDGWTIKDIKFTGSYSYSRHPRERLRLGSRKMATAIILKNSSEQRNATKAMLKEIILVGPKNGKWQDAFR